MWDNISTEVYDFNHVPGGSNVLYMDGHVEFLKWQPIRVASIQDGNPYIFALVASDPGDNTELPNANARGLDDNQFPMTPAWSHFIQSNRGGNDNNGDGGDDDGGDDDD